MSDEGAKVGQQSILLPLSALALLCVVTGMAACSDSDGGEPPAPSPDSSTPTYGPLGERRDLPVDERVDIEHLSGPVDVVRDKDGRPHIYASTVADAMRVEGYLVAKDRTVQLELLRRNAAGRIAEIFGGLEANTIDSDIAFRTIGLARTAKAEYDALPQGEVRELLDAYADGVTQLFRKIRSEEIDLPSGIIAVPREAFTDWTGIDSLTVAKLQSYLFSYNTETALRLESLFATAQAKFTKGAADPLFAKRAGFERDFVRFAPSELAFTTTGYPGAKTAGTSNHTPLAAARKSPVAAAQKPENRPSDTIPLVAAAEGYLSAVQRANASFMFEGFGSNNWAVSPARSATGHVLLANDPHLGLGAPSTFWPVSIEVQPGQANGLKISGVAFPGVPGIILGHNEHVAWGSTVASYQVTDVYAEKLTADGTGVTFKDAAVPFETVDEVINVPGKEPYTYKVKLVPHHGPVLPTIREHRVVDPDPAVGALSVKWTGLTPSESFTAIVKLMRAKSVDDARTALDGFTVGAQNWVVGDSGGNILWTSHARLPIRDPRAFAWDPIAYKGTLPCRVLPGNGTAEWKGYLADDLVPWAKNPASGYIATANNDPMGDTADNDPSNGKLPDGTPMYLSSFFDIGFREARIQKLIESHQGKFTPEIFAAIQGDVRSNLGARLAPEIRGAIDRAEAERKAPGTHPDLSAIVKDAGYDPVRIAAARAMLEAWGTESDYKASSGIDLETNKPLSNEGSSPEAISARASQATLLFNLWVVRMLDRTFGDELGQIDVKTPFQAIRFKSLLHLFATKPSELATFDAATGDSAVWDDMATQGVVESRSERILRSLLDAFAWFAAQSTELENGRWGAHHTIRFNTAVSLFSSLSIPPAGDTAFPNGFPHAGDLFSVDASDYTAVVAAAAAPSFKYTGGAAQRFVVSVEPSGPRAWNALPGGAVWDTKSPHFRDQAELWRKNQSHAVPFLLEDVVAAKESRIVVKAP